MSWYGAHPTSLTKAQVRELLPGACKWTVYFVRVFITHFHKWPIQESAICDGCGCRVNMRELEVEAKRRGWL